MEKMEHFQKGTEYHTYKELLAAKWRYEQDTKTLLTTKKSAKYAPDDPRCEDLVYSRIQYQCKAGEERKSTSKGNRAVTSGKMNCPVVITLSVKEGKLCVLNSMLQHENHTQDFETFMKYPENLRLKPNELRYAKELLNKGFNKKVIKAKLKERRGGMPVSQKFWAQINKSLRRDAAANGNTQNVQGEQQFSDEPFDQSLSSLCETQTYIPEIKVEQDFDTTGSNTSDDDTHEGDYGPSDPLSDMYEKCMSDASMNDSKNTKLKKDFNDWFKDLIPGEQLSYSEWLWQLEFNFPTLDKLNFIKYGIILGMTIVNKYYLNNSMTIDGNGVKEVGAEFGRRRKRPLRPMSNHHTVNHSVNNMKDEHYDENHESETFDREESVVSGEADVQINEEVEPMTSPLIQPSKMFKEPSGTSTPIVQPENAKPSPPAASQPNEPINCKMCPEVFPTHSQLYHHMCKFHTGHIGLNCPICNKRFQYERNLNQHIATVHADNGNATNCDPGRSICEICGASFDKISSLRSHSRYVHSIEKFFCQYCNRKLSSKKSLKEHIQFQHELTFVTHECEDCQRIFKYKSSYRLHMKKQHGIHFG